MLATGVPVKSLHNPFRSAAEARSLGESSTSAQTDLDLHPTALEREPSPTEAQSRSPSPEPAPEPAQEPVQEHTSTPPAHPSQEHLSPPEEHPAPADDVPATTTDTAEAPAIPPRTYDPPPGPPPGPSVDEALMEELPPAYTPTADVRLGETSVEFGPRRPFGNTPSRPYAPWQRSQRPSWQPANGGNPGWTGYPGTARARRPPVGAPLIQVDPPPQHPTLPPRPGGAPAVPPPQQRPLSDFARDFYAARPNSQELGEGSGEGAISEGQTNRPVTPPRPGQAGTNGQSETPDDGRPTNKPVPGHPLLNSGKVLVYPAGYECPKCHNTGYKHFDPSNPCTKCWSKYAKAYAGPLTYAPWTPANGVPPTESHAGHNLQRPLPHPQSPTLSHRYSHSLTDLGVPPPPPHPDLGRSASTSRQYPAYTGANAGASPYAQPQSPARTGGSLGAGRGGAFPPASWVDRSPSLSSISRMQYGRAPPPGATVVRPGDPRIGGRLCWRCGGSGVTSLMIFDEQTCPVCNGLGRTF